MVREVVVEVRLFNSYVGLRGRGRLRAVGGGRGWTDLPGILLRENKNPQVWGCLQGAARCVAIAPTIIDCDDGAGIDMHM